MADRFTGHYGPMAYAETVTVVSDPREVVAALPDARPTVWVAVPRIWEKLKAALEAQGVTDPAAMPDEARAGGAREARPRPGPGLLRRARRPTPIEVLEYFRDLGLADHRGLGDVGALAASRPPTRRAPSGSGRSASRSPASR